MIHHQIFSAKTMNWRHDLYYRRKADINKKFRIGSPSPYRSLAQRLTLGCDLNWSPQHTGRAVWTKCCEEPLNSQNAQSYLDIILECATLVLNKSGRIVLLRRIKKNVKDENWFAVGLDFLIVVSGVFIGLQLGNWNEARQTHSTFLEAGDRLVAESYANLETTENFLADVDTRLTKAHDAISALRACDSDETSQQKVLDGANAIRGTATLHLRQTALSAITENDAFMSLLSKQKREHLQEFERQLNQSVSTLKWLESRPFTQHIEDSPYVNYNDLTPVPNMEGVMIRQMTIDAPLDQICVDKSFLKPFYLWERTATFQSLRARQIRGWLVERIETAKNGD